MQLVRRLVFVAFCLGVLLVAPASAVGNASARCAAPASDPSTLVMVPLGGLAEPGDVVDVELVLSLAGKEVLRESHRVTVPAAADAVLPAWLGGLAMSPDSKEGGLAAAELEIIVDGRAMNRLPVGALLRSPSAKGTLAASVPRGPATVSTFSCPNAQPFCEEQYNYCYEVLCEYGGRGQSCVTFCSVQVDECVFGAYGSYVTKTLQAVQYSPSVCAFYPWYKLTSPKIWDAVVARYLNQEYETIYCQATGQSFVTLVEEWTTFPICYTETPFGCSGNASYLGGECRW